MSKKNHPFHLVTPSPWPLLLSMSIMNTLIGVVKWMHFNSSLLAINGLISIILILTLWWRDVIRESTFQGMHTIKVVKGLKMGMILFILSEVFFFMSFFWAYMHSMLSPSIEIGMMWPPKGIKPFNPYSIPLLNTMILISSGMSITWTHHSILKNIKNESIISLLITIILGIYFSCIQLYEYINATFTISDGIYGSTFYMTTGFHGIHVIIGTTFLLVCLIRMIKMHFTKTHHFGFEAAAWYWHFVDVIWLLLYILIYWWTY